MLGVMLQRWDKRLNPYCNGRYSWRPSRTVRTTDCSKVLILIVMEDTLGGAIFSKLLGHREGLNPYCNGRYSWRVMTQIVLNMVVERLFVSISLQISKINSVFLRAAKVQ